MSIDAQYMRKVPYKPMRTKKKIFLISQPKYVMGTPKNHLSDTVLLCIHPKHVKIDGHFYAKNGFI